MKKNFIGATALSFFFAASCNKNNDNSAKNTWKLNGTTYTATQVTRQSFSATAMVSAFDEDGNNLTISFNRIPSEGAYKVVSAVGTSDPNTIAIVAGKANNGYRSTGNDNISATVRLNSNKIIINIPDVWVKSVTGSDSTLLSVSDLTEQ